MTKLEDIEKAVEKLPAPELERFRAWFERFDAARFDEKPVGRNKWSAAKRIAPFHAKAIDAEWRNALRLLRPTARHRTPAPRNFHTPPLQRA